jgi:hypothetical protein
MTLTPIFYVNMYRLILCLLIPVMASAQWSDDGLYNLILVDRSNNQVQPKIIATDDGGAYISWF